MSLKTFRSQVSVAKGYEIRGYVVDGQEALAVYCSMKDAVAQARAGKGPTLIEMKSCRFYDHAMFAGADVGKFGAFGLPHRSDKDVHAGITNDPVRKFRRTHVSLGVMTEADADDPERSVQDQVLASFEFARQGADHVLCVVDAIAFCDRQVSVSCSSRRLSAQSRTLMSRNSWHWPRRSTTRAWA